jgi:hypothetical protein
VGVVVEECRQDLALDLLARGRATPGDEVHHVGIAVELDEVVDVVLGERPQLQAVGLERKISTSEILLGARVRRS